MTTTTATAADPTAGGVSPRTPSVPGAEAARATPGRTRAVGLVVALLSALAFGTSGTLGKGLLESGWSPGAAVLARALVGALVLAVPAALALRGRWHLLRADAGTVVAFGVVAVAGCQLAYFTAVQTVDVAVALLVEYLAPALLVLLAWARGRRPSPLVLVGTLAALGGLVLVLDVTGGAQVDLVGVGWALVAACGLAAYFLLSARPGAGLPPLALATGGLLVGAAVLALAGLVGLLPLTTSTADVALAGALAPWWVAVLALGVVAGAVAYATGVAGARRLGSRTASFVGLTEVVFAVLVAWVLLGQLPVPVQLLGGALIVAGAVAVNADEGRLARTTRPARTGRRRAAVLVEGPPAL
ncbi:EamA family transporter [Pseudokineococcus sp. 1T1Z-3]|uniref:EamA family transporter n=1 Tax=Pseudokineococcus sp. 1T1Z-3 TaxID=3132745 RepID=UPI003097B410